MAFSLPHVPQARLASSPEAMLVAPGMHSASSDARFQLLVLLVLTSNAVAAYGIPCGLIGCPDRAVTIHPISMAALCRWFCGPIAQSVRPGVPFFVRSTHLHAEAVQPLTRLTSIPKRLIQRRLIQRRLIQRRLIEKTVDTRSSTALRRIPQLPDPNSAGLDTAPL